MDAWKEFVVLYALVLLGCKSSAPCTVDAESLDFGEVEVGSGGAQRRIVVTNPSDEDREVTAVPLDRPFGVFPLDRLGLQAHSEEAWTVGFGPDDGLLHLDELILQGGGSCDFTLPLKGLGSGTLSVSPELLEFTVGAGQRVEKEVLLRNTRRTPMTVTLSWSFRAGPKEALSFGTPATLEIPAGGLVSVPIIASPPGWETVRAALMINTGSTFMRVEVTITPSSPLVEVSPQMVSVPQIGFDVVSQPRGFAERVFRVRNSATSGDPRAPHLQIVSSFVVFGVPAEVEVTWPPLPDGLAEGESAEVRVRMTPFSPGPKTYGVNLRLDPVGVQRVEINTQANALPPCAVQATPADVLLLEDKGDGGLEGVVTFTNTSSEYCVVDDPRFSPATPSQFAMIEGAFAQGEIAPGNEHRVTIAGPKSVDAGTIGSFGFHVFSPNSNVEWIDLRSP